MLADSDITACSSAELWNVLTRTGKRSALVSPHVSEYLDNIFIHCRMIPSPPSPPFYFETVWKTMNLTLVSVAVRVRVHVAQ